jgi:hypothetical protein
MPYGRRGAFWALLGPDTPLRGTDYDANAALALPSKWSRLCTQRAIHSSEITVHGSRAGG